MLAFLRPSERANRAQREPLNTRKLNAMITDLHQMHEELLTSEEKNEAKRQAAGDVKGLDKWERGYRQLSGELAGLRGAVERLNALRKNLPWGQSRSIPTIRLESENVERLKGASDQFAVLKELQQKDENKEASRRRNPLIPRRSPESQAAKDTQLAERRKLLILLGDEMKQLTRENAKSSVQGQGAEIDAQENKVLAERLERMREEKQDEKRLSRQQRRDQSRHRALSQAIGVEMANIPEPSAQEVEFEKTVAKNIEAENELLQAISQGLDELKDLANEAGKHLAVQEEMLQKVDEKMDDVNRQFKSANRRLKTLLEESGGCTRWCPMLVCAVVLLALLGYISGIV